MSTKVKVKREEILAALQSASKEVEDAYTREIDYWEQLIVGKIANGNFRITPRGIEMDIKRWIYFGRYIDYNNYNVRWALDERLKSRGWMINDFGMVIFMWERQKLLLSPTGAYPL